MKYHAFTCPEATVIIASPHSDYVSVGELLISKLRELGRTDLIHKLEAREIDAFGDPHIAFTDIQSKQ